jgi:hypothetical protein
MVKQWTKEVLQDVVKEHGCTLRAFHQIKAEETLMCSCMQLRCNNL